MTMEGPASAQQDQRRLGWYQEAKFGLFIHWGAYSVAGVEASWPIMAPELSAAMFATQITIAEKEYATLPQRFNPVDFDPDAWVRLAQQAGMRYIVITSKHHDGFCMFDAPGTDYKITNTPYGKDICLELAQACARAGMPLGFYYSPPDMHHPGYRDTRKPATSNWTGEPQRKAWAEYLDYMESHIRKLLTDYGEVAVLWFDGLTNHGKYDPSRFHKLIHELSPNTLINDRLGDGYDFITPEQFIPKTGIPARTYKPPSGIDPGGDGFFKTVSFLSSVPIVRGGMRKLMRKFSDGTLELTPVHKEPYPSPEHFQPWETCMTMGQTWAYNPKETDWKSPETLVRNLVNVVSRGGNYLLNIGPTAQGTFPPEAVERLQAIGRWMHSYQQAIYGATYTPLQGQPWGQAARNGDELYLFIFSWPGDGKLTVDSFPGQAKQVSLFNGEVRPFRQDGRRLVIDLPAESPGLFVPVLVVDIAAAEKGWHDYSAPVSARITPAQHIRKQAVNSAVINAILNGLIAFFSYRTRGSIPYGEAAVDILITVFIITFLTAWLTVSLARNEVIKGNLTRLASPQRWLKLPKSPALRGLLIALACTILFGGVFLDGLLYLVSPVELSNWAYFILKTLYTGASGALASALTIFSVVNDAKRR